LECGVSTPLSFAFFLLRWSTTRPPKKAALKRRFLSFAFSFAVEHDTAPKESGVETPHSKIRLPSPVAKKVDETGWAWEVISSDGPRPTNEGTTWRGRRRARSSRNFAK
jgi:hypothetical protein